MEPQQVIPMDKLTGVSLKDNAERPVYEKITRAGVVSADWVYNGVYEDRSGKKYTAATLKVDFQASNGTVRFTEFYGGCRIYFAEDGSMDRAWIGKDSFLGKVRTVLTDHFGTKPSDLLAFLRLLRGKIVGVKTETVTILDKTFTKNVIKSIIESPE